MDTDPVDLLDRITTAMDDAFPGWEPADGNLDYWIMQSFAAEAAEIQDLASAVPETIFMVFGDSILGVPPIDAAPATSTTTWTMIDNKGYTIPDMSLVGLRDANGDLVAYYTTGDIVIPAGSTVTPTGAVPIVAVEPGVEATGLGTAGQLLELVSPMIFVDHIILEAPTTGGADAELVGDYLNRLVTQLAMMTQTPILPIDFSRQVIANVEGVYRATTIDGYNPASGGSYGNDRMVTVAAIDETGAPVSTGVKTAIDNYLEGLREINFIINEMDPKYTTINVVAQVHPLPTFDNMIVVGNVQAMVANYVNPLTWGIPANEVATGDFGPVWVDLNTFRWNDFLSAMTNVQGVDHVISLTINGGTADIAMAAPASLPQLGTISVTWA
jgi:uncharacterized phage protein gp47/JayE